MARKHSNRIHEAKPDLVLLDIQMPVLDGYAVLRSIRNNPPSPPPRMIAVTAYAMRGDSESGRWQRVSTTT